MNHDLTSKDEAVVASWAKTLAQDVFVAWQAGEDFWILREGAEQLLAEAVAKIEGKTWSTEALLSFALLAFGQRFSTLVERSKAREAFEGARVARLAGERRRRPAPRDFVRDRGECYQPWATA